MVPASPEDIKIPVPPSGSVSPFPDGIGTPKHSVSTSTSALSGSSLATEVSAVEAAETPVEEGIAVPLGLGREKGTPLGLKRTPINPMD